MTVPDLTPRPRRAPWPRRLLGALALAGLLAFAVARGDERPPAPQPATVDAPPAVQFEFWIWHVVFEVTLGGPEVLTVSYAGLR